MTQCCVPRVRSRCMRNLDIEISRWIHELSDVYSLILHIPGMSVIGIDFGDESLTVAAARRGGIDVLQNDIGKRKTRSGMSFGSVQRFIGDEFTNQYLSNATNSVIYAKRLIGKMFDDPEVAHEQKFIPSKLVADANGRVAIQVSLIPVASSENIRTIFCSLTQYY